MAQHGTAVPRRHGRLGSVVRITTALALGVLSLPLLATSASAASSSVLLTTIDGAPNAGLTAYQDGSGASDDIYQASKESDPPSQWQLSNGSGVLDTGSDITDVYTDHLVDDSTGDLWFYLGYARSADGVATGVVELNQQPDLTLSGGKAGSTLEVPDRQPGDLRITFTQASGATQLQQTSVQAWTGTGWGTAVSLPGTAYASQVGDGGRFAELAIDLTATGLAPGCAEAFTEVNLRTRSSDTDQAELKDYVAPVPVSVQARCRAITVRKFAATGADRQPLGGARFQLWADNDGSGTLTAGDTKVDGEVTAEQGSHGNTYTWSNRPWGAYLVQETAAPAGYQLDPTAHPVTLGANTPDNGTAIVDVDDPEVGAAIQAQKYDATTHDPLPGARFQLWADSNGNNTFDPATSASAGDTRVGAEVTADRGNDGNAYTWSNLAYGTYFVQETAAPDGYRVDTGTPAKVTLAPTDAGSTVPVKFADAPLTPTIVVTKTDAGGHPVQGAGFTLWKDDGDGSFDARKDTQIGAEVLADQGADHNSYTWDTGLAWGTYFVKETTTPAGYGTDPAGTDGVKTVPLPITTPGGAATVDFADPRLTAGITVHKYDFTSHAPLPGATFTLYTDDNGDGTLDSGDQQVPGSAQAADSGPDHNTATWTGLAWGQDYLVQETVAPAGYDTDLSADHGAKLVSLTAADAGSTKPVDFFDPRTPAAADPGTITVFKTDADTHEAVDGAMFRLYLDSNGNGRPETGELRYSDPPRTAKGTYEWQVEPGSYLVEEASPPDGYLLPSPAYQAVKVAAGGNATVTFADPQKLSTITVTKTDANTGAPLDGATFTLTDADGTSLGVPTTSAPGSYTWTGLRMGDYTVTETAPPPGYTLPAKPSQSVDLDGSDAGSTVPLSFQDTQETSTIVVHKYDADTTRPLDGATFTLTRDGAPVSTPPTRTGTGTYTWTGLPMGSYTVTEAAPPPGYLPPDQGSLPAGATQDALFDGSTAGGTAVLDFYDEARPVPPPPPGTPGTDLVVTKVDQVGGDPLDTATFQLYGDDGDGVLTSTDPAHGAPQQTSGGQVRWSDLPAGTYFVVETTAPQGYRTAAPLTVVIDPAQSGGTVHRQVADPRLPTTLQVLKVDDLTQQPLAGAAFQAYVDHNGNGRVDAGDRGIGPAQVTDAQGVAGWTGLGFGSYLLREVTAPTGYTLPPVRDQQVVIDRTNAGGVLQVVFRDAAEPGFSIRKSALERSADGRWVPSDGTVAFGDLVRYQVTVRPLGSQALRAVTVSDFVPGFAPGATGPKATYVDGTAGCTQQSCRARYDAATGLVRWRLGDLRPGRSRTVGFTVRMPELPAHPTYVQGVYTEHVVNVAEASWQSPAPGTARATGSLTRSMRSNPVRTAVVDAPLVLGIPTVSRPRPTTGTSGLGGLPNTGAPAHLGSLGLLGWLSVLCGGWLMIRRPGAREPQEP